MKPRKMYALKNFFLVSILFQLISTVLAQQLSFCVKNEEATAYLSTDNFGSPDKVGLTNSILTKDECLITCTNMDTCAGCQCSNNGECRMNANQLQNGSQLISAPGLTHFQKICLPAKDAFCSTTFSRESQKILVGYAQIVYNAPTLAACLAKCLETTKPEAEFDCGSLHYYYRDQQCILNSQSKANFPDLFLPEKVNEDEVDYVENNCFATWSQWAPWSKCRGPDLGRQIRFRHCNLADTCLNGTGIEMQTCLPEIDSQMTSFVAVETTIIPDPLTIDTDKLSVASTPDPPPNTTADECSYCRGPCRAYRNLGFESYGDCLRGRLNGDVEIRKANNP